MTQGESGIDYADYSWGPWRGCRKIAAGCLHCYAERDMKRYGRDHSKLERASDATFYAPLARDRQGNFKWPPGSRVFVCPWSDFFLEDVPRGWRDEAQAVIRTRRDLIFIIPTKRLDQIESWHGEPNTILLTSCATQADVDRETPKLIEISRDYFPVKGLSIEPLIEPLIDPIRIGVTAIGELDWVVIGCESGPERRTCKLAWILDVIRQCKAAGIPCYVKQIPLPKLSQRGRHSAMIEAITSQSVLDWDLACKDHDWTVSRDPSEWPIVLRVRQFPKPRKEHARR